MIEASPVFGVINNTRSILPRSVIPSEARDLLCSSPLVIKVSVARDLTNLRQ
jgi:hypothetical protein